MIEWVVFLGIGLVAGIGIGLYLSHIGALRSKKQLELEAELHHAQDALHQYRQEVAQHFVHTSTLINEMTQSYRAVFDHLSAGARKLCGTDVNARLQDIPRQSLLHAASAGGNVDRRQAATPPPAAAVAAVNSGNAGNEAIDEHAQLADATAGEIEVPQTAAAAPGAADTEQQVDVALIKSVSESEQQNDEHADFAGEQDAPPGVHPVKSNRTVH